MNDIIQAMQDLVTANRILAREGVVDAFGHVSMRHPDHPDRYLISCSRSPELVTLDDIMEFTLDGEALDDRGLPAYAERFIHGAVYETRSDINSVVHNHSHAVIPFGVTGVSLLYAVMVDSLVEGQVRSLLLAAVGIWITVVLVLRSTWAGTIAMIPNLLPVLVVLGLMGYVGVTLNLGTAMISSVCLGIAVDDTILFMTRYRRNY